MNRNDRRVLIAALIVGFLALTGIFFLGHPSESRDPRESRFSRNSRDTSPSKPYAVTEARQAETFPFDPNTADSTELLRLGLQPWQVRNIYKYRARGGVYRKKEDFARLYGLTVKDYRRLEPYIRISSDYQPAATLFTKQEIRNEELDNRLCRFDLGQRMRNEAHPSPSTYPQKITEGEHIVLNVADTTMLRKVPGIGSYYAKEIIRYGQWLGGYVNVNQLDEIDDFPKSFKKFFVIEQPNPKKLNLNKLTLQQLRRHPYINYYQAKAITDYRRLHGKIQSLRDLALSPDFNEKDMQRLEPYVTF